MSARLGVLTSSELRQRMTGWLLVPVLAAIGWYSSSGPGSRVALVALAAAATLPLALRRRFPVSVLVVVAAATGTAALLYDDYWPLGAVVATFTVAAYCEPDRRQLVAAGALVGLLVAIGASGWQLWGLLQMAPLVAAWTFGESVRSRNEYLRAVEDRAAQLEREQDANSRRVVAETQAAMARDVHDLVGHSLSVIAVQAAAAGHIFERNPGRARDAVETIEATADRALDELRRVLGTAKPDERLAPAPQLERLDELLQQVRLTGLEATLTVHGEQRPLPAPLEVSAYRIIQEALTNTIRHAQARHVHVLLDYDPDALVIAVEDDGTGAAVCGGTTHGLISLRERAAAFDGTLEAAAGPNGGFRIRAHLPLAQPSK